MRALLPRTLATASAWFLGGLIALAATLLHAAPQTGWWWNPNESGRGFFLEVQGPRMFMAGYFYAEDGRATWLASNDPMPDANFYQGRLLAFRNGQALVGSYRPPDAAVDAGGVSIMFTDDSHGRLTWAGGSFLIERYRFQRGANASFQPFTGWWWNPDESGRGMSIEMQGDHMFIGTYMYDAGGNPIWYVGDAFMETPTRFRGSLMQFGNGQTLLGAYRAPTPPVAAGTVTVDFSASNRATVTFTDEKSLAGKTGKTIVIKPFYDAPTPGRSPDVWSGSVDSKVTTNLGPVLYQYITTITLMNWEKDYGSNPELPTLIQYPAKYRISYLLGDLRVRHETPGCSAASTVILNGLTGEMTLEKDGYYSGYISKVVPVSLTAYCDGSAPFTIVVDYYVDLIIQGVLVNGVMAGDFPPNDIPEVIREGSWSFTSSNR